MTKRKWIWLSSVGFMVLLGLVAVFLLITGDSEKKPAAENLKIYWNVDAAEYRTGILMRNKSSDGYYYMTFAVDAEQQRLPVADYDLAVAIDMLDVVGLVFNDAGVVVDYRRVSEFTGGAVANNFYVTDVQGNTVTCNSSVTLGGYEVKFTLQDDTPIYDVSMSGIVCGIPGTIHKDDQVTAIAGNDGEILCVFVRSYIEPGALYWNVTRKYDSLTRRSTREPDATGYYSYEMLCNGETVTVRTRDYEIACQMDSYNAPCMGLTFDEDGYVIETFRAKDVTSGTVFGSYSRVTQVDGNKLYTKKLTGTNVGTEYVGILAENCKIINTTPVGTRGAYTQLRYGDQIHGLTDNRGKLCYVFVTNRVSSDTYDFCWNFDYVSGTKETARTPDSNGVYRIKLTGGGEVFTGWTKDKALVDLLDTSRFRGVKRGADGEILDVIPSSYVYGGSYFCSWYYVDKIEGDQITVSFTKNTETETKVLTGKLSDDVEIYNTSKLVNSYQGEKTTLQVGDQIYAQNDMYGNIRAIYVVNRYLRSGVYYNLERKWDDTAKCTKRTPDDQGVYSFRMAYNGKQVEVKTRSRSVANDIDSQVAKVLGLVMDKNGYVVKAVHANQTEECKGSVSVSYVLVTGINGNKVTTYKESNGTKKTIYLASNVKIMNVSGQFDDHQGEYTKLRVGDKIHCLADQNKLTNYVYITTRKPTVVKHQCTNATAKTTWYRWNGKTAFTESGHYVLTEDITMDKRVSIKAGQDITLCLNGHTITCADRVFSIYGKLTLCDHKHKDGSYGGKIITTYSNKLDSHGNVEAKVYGGLAYMYNEKQDVKLTIKGGNYIHKGQVAVGGLVYVANRSDSGFKAEFDLYDGVLSGGNATESGGAVAVRNQGVFNMYGGVIRNCTAVTGGGVHAQSAKAIFRMIEGRIENCTATDVGAGISIGNGTASMTGGKVVDCSTTGNGGSVNVSTGSFTMTGGSLEGGNAKEGGNLRIGTAAIFTLGGNAVITDGSATNGGNAVVYGTLKIQDNAVLKDGTATNKGGNINAFANLEAATANIIISGGTISGGSAAVDSGSIRLDANDGTVNMVVTGGTIGAGKAPYAPCVKVGTAEKISMTVGGNAQIHQVHLEGGKHMTIHEKGLENTSSIGVTVSDSKKPFVSITDPEDQECFHSCAQDEAQVINVDNALYLKVVHSHCECGGNLTGVALDAHKANCQLVEDWTQVDGSNFKDGGIFEKPNNYLNFKQSGYYYLSADVATGYVIEIKADQEITLCLNGHQLKSDAAGNSAIRVYGELKICDCHGGGKVLSHTAKAAGVVFVLTNGGNTTGGIFDLYGGDLMATDNDYTANAGAIQVGNSGTNPGIFNMYGGSVSGGTANKGGNILLGTEAAIMNMYGGSVTGGSVQTNDTSADRNRGGNIYVNKGTLNVYGGSISGGTCAADDPNPGLGGDIFQIGGTVYLNTAFDDLDYANDGTGYMTLGESFTATSVTCQTLADSAKIAEGTQEQAEAFVVTQEGYEKLFENGEITMVNAAVLYHRHCVCGGNLAPEVQGYHGQNCTVVKDWIAITKDNFVVGDLLVNATTSGRVNFAQNGHYYLDEDVSTSYVLELLKDADITLCLNGHTLTSTATGNSAIRLSGKLNICDCKGGGKLTGKSPKAAGLIFVLTSTADAANGTTLNLYGGDLEMTDKNYTANAGVIQVGNSGNNPGVFNMYGGSISGGTANKGGNILIGTAAATMNLYGGSVVGGSVKTNDSSTDRNRGGNIYVNKGTLNVYGGEISGGTCAADDPNPGLGGDIYLTGGKVQFYIPMTNLDVVNDGTGDLILPEDDSGTEDP